MTKNSRTDEELWQAIQDVDRDVLDPATPASVVDEALSEMGLDPAAVRAKGRALVNVLLEKKRLAWMDEARRQRDMLRARATSTADYSGMSKQLLLAEFGRRQRVPGVGGEIRALFQNRKPEESSEEDLRSLLEEMDRVAAMHEAKGDDGDDGG